MFSRGLWTLPAITLQTSRAFLRHSPPSPNLIDSMALALVDEVNIPAPPANSFFEGNPCLKIRQTPQLLRLHRAEEPTPSEQATIVPWNLRSSFPSAKQRECFLDNLLALILTISRYSSNLARVFCMLWTFKTLSICPQLLYSDFNQLVWQIISTIFLDESPSLSSVTGKRKSCNHINKLTVQVKRLLTTPSSVLC